MVERERSSLPFLPQLKPQRSSSRERGDDFLSVNFINWKRKREETEIREKKERET